MVSHGPWVLAPQIASTWTHLHVRATITCTWMCPLFRCPQVHSRLSHVSRIGATAMKLWESVSAGGPVLMRCGLTAVLHRVSFCSAQGGGRTEESRDSEQPWCRYARCSHILRRYS